MSDQYRKAEATIQQEPIVHWLSGTTAYSPAPQSVQHLQTHISHVFIAGDLVYKLKKPVRFDFLDFSTLAAREHACREEVRLNQRLARDVYLGVVPVTRTADAGFCLGGQGEVVDWLVQMRRMPVDRMVDAMHRGGRLQPEHIEDLVKLLARFFARRLPVEIAPEAYRQRYLSHVLNNRQELLAAQRLPRELVLRTHGFQSQLLQLQPELFDERVRAGRIVEGHGDLRAEHICLSEPPVIFDCIEFNQEFRQLDVADELAFLAAECDFIGADWVGPQLLERFSQLSGDCPPRLITAFYKAYRASVRAKVAALRCEQLPGEPQVQAAREAAAHLHWADRYAAPYQRPLVLVVGGLSGSGKSTLARPLAEALSADLLRSDMIRQELFGISAGQGDPGRYQPEARQRVYQELLRRAAALHRQQVAVVLDATFPGTTEIHAAAAIALEPRALFLAIECHCRPEVARQRIVSRLAEKRDASEASPDVLAAQQTNRQTWPAAIPQLRVDTEQPVANQMRIVLAEVARRWRSA